MLNCFDTDVALDVGLNAAILYKNIQFWCEKNRTNGQNENEGLFWTYNSISAFEEQFPYFSGKQIRTALKILEERGYIKSGNFNKLSYDRTKWYADLKANSICPEREIHLPLRSNGIPTEGKPIPYINTNINTDIKKERKTSFDDVLDAEEIIRTNPDLRETFLEFIKFRKMIKKPLTDKALRLNIAKARELSGGNPRKMKAIVEQSISRGWSGMFPLKDETEGKDDFFEKIIMEETYAEQDDCGGSPSLADSFPVVL